MKRKFVGCLILATLAVPLYKVTSQSNAIVVEKTEHSVAAMPRSEVALASFTEPATAPTETPTPIGVDAPLPGLDIAIAKIPDKDKRTQVETSIKSYREAVDGYKESLKQLPSPVAEALLAGDEDAVAKAAAQDTSIIQKIATVQERYTDAAKARDAVALAIAAVGNPTVAADLHRILAIIDSDMPDGEKFKNILEVILRRLLFLLEALAAAESGTVSPGLINGIVDDLDVIRGAFARLVASGAQGSGSSLETYLTDGSKIDFQLPNDINLQRIQDLVNSANSVEFSVQDGQPTLRVVSPAGEVLLLISQSKDGPAVVIVD